MVGHQRPHQPRHHNTARPKQPRRTILSHPHTKPDPYTGNGTPFPARRTPRHPNRLLLRESRRSRAPRGLCGITDGPSAVPPRPMPAACGRRRPRRYGRSPTVERPRGAAPRPARPRSAAARGTRAAGRAPAPRPAWSARRRTSSTRGCSRSRPPHRHDVSRAAGDRASRGHVSTPPRGQPSCSVAPGRGQSSAPVPMLAAVARISRAAVRAFRARGPAR